MKFNKWTLGLAAVGVVSLASAARADEKVSQLNTALSNTTISGYVDVGAQYQTANGAAYSLPSANSLSLNTVDIALDKPLDATPFSAGYHIELWTGAGTTAPAPAATGSLVRQAYLALGTTIAGQEIDWKIGVWDTLIGYEGLTSGNNPNYTHSYGFFIEPTDHTGVQGTYKVNDEITVQAAIADDQAGNAATINGAPTETYPLSAPEFLALVSFTAPDSFGALKGATLSVGGTDNTSDAGPKNIYVGATAPTPLTALKLGAAYDYEDLGISAGHINVFGVYGTYTATDKLTFNVRGEYADQSGLPAGGTFGTPATGGLFASVPGAAAEHGEEFTATASYQLWANVLSRVEVRWDHAETIPYYANNGPTSGQKNAILLAAQLIYTF
jgi:hypothetical protein